MSNALHACLGKGLSPMPTTTTSWSLTAEITSSKIDCWFRSTMLRIVG
ncbi:hypothetical protein GALL_403780 [mine drainage metagenome]|uniref:Uncharacterized protein n=1 Tax=mine drainage metagenome TaxID=410659 RepID=A0A1J5QD61_9ZZZZ